MGKILGISDLPVSTIMSPFEPVTVPKNPLEAEIKHAEAQKLEQDTLIIKELAKVRTPKITKVRNGISRMMSYFTKKMICNRFL